MADAANLLRSPPVVARGALSHRYLERLLTLSEAVAGDWLREDAARPLEMMRLLDEFEGTFAEGYDPAPIVQELASLRGLEQRLREQLLEVLEREYRKRFRPEERLTTCRAAAAAFRRTFEAWYSSCSPESAPLSSDRWEMLLTCARELRALLSAPELRTRWIP